MTSDDIIRTRADREELDRLEVEERRERRRNRLLIALIFLISIPVAIWVGSLINGSQDTATDAIAGKEQAQVEKFNLAQQIATACAEPDGLDEQTQARLCRDARTIVREGPQGAQGVPGVQGVQGVQGIQGIRGFDGANGKDGADGKDGIPGVNGTNGVDGKDGAPGKDGVDGKDGVAGVDGADGKDGQPPFSWVVFDERGNPTETCTRTTDFDPASPTYTCIEG